MGIDDRNLAMPDGVQEIVRNIPVAHAHEMVLHPQTRGGIERGLAFVELPVLEADREGFKRCRPSVDHRSEHGGRVDPARKVGSDRMIAVQSNAPVRPRQTMSHAIKRAVAAMRACQPMSASAPS